MNTRILEQWVSGTAFQKILTWSFSGGSVVRNLPANTGDVRDEGSTPRSGRSPGEGMLPFQILAWEIPWTEEPDGLHSVHETSKSDS